MKYTLALIALLLLVSCGQQSGDANSAQVADIAANVSKGDNAQEIDPNAAISVQQLETILNSGTDIYLLDVRTQKEYKTAHLAGTDDLISYDSLDVYADKLPTDKNTEIFIYCRSGRRSDIAAKALQTKGFTNVHNVLGGVFAWQASGSPIQSGN